MIFTYIIAKIRFYSYKNITAVNGERRQNEQRTKADKS